MRPSGRNREEKREIKITRKYTKHPEGSVLVEFGDTKVICNATVNPGVPRFLRGMDKGWITAEYGMLPRSTSERMARESVKGKQAGRTQEIQRLIARSLRACVNLKKLGENTITVDCDVIQADGGTRTASITGACVALYDAIEYMKKTKAVKSDPFIQFIASVSVGVYKDEEIVDLDYIEDSNAQTDMNVVMTEKGEFIELQGTAEDGSFSAGHLNSMLALANKSIRELIEIQKKCLKLI